jgi:anhydro-N-acetylmuramic acid kinase
MLVLGVNTGTSVDGVDFSLVDWDLNDLKNYSIVKEQSYQFDPQVKHDVEILIGKQRGILEDISNLNFLYSQFIAALVREFQKDLTGKIELIGIHGQTIFHGAKSTFQLGNPSIVAELTGISTVADFRSADIAAGGCGAPLTSYLDHVLIRSETESRGTLNLGGIANISVMQVGKDIIAYDTGPANTLIDLLISKTAYFAQAAPKSTGRELFDEKYADKFLDLGNKDNILATVTYFTAKTISNELQKYNLKKVYISGGGMRNKSIMDNLKKLNPVLEFLSHREFNINCQYKEAILFSLLAFTCYHKIPNNLPSSTGARRATILGVLAQR